MSLAAWLQGPVPTPAEPASAAEPGTEPASPPSLPPFDPSAESGAEAPASAAPAAETAPPAAPAAAAPPSPAPAASGGYHVGQPIGPGQGTPGNPYLVGGGVPDPTPTPRSVQSPPPREWKRFVFAVLGAMTFGIGPTPSVNGTLFFGGRLPNKRWALGYAGTLSLGMAERYWLGMITHRHHLTALHNFKERGFASVGAGVGFFYFVPALVEAEGRVGARLGQYRRFVIGGMVRLGYNFHFKEGAPMPQFGAFLGWSFL